MFAPGYFPTGYFASGYFAPGTTAVIVTFGSRSGVHRGKGVGSSGVTKKNVTVGRGSTSEPTSEE